MNEEDFFYTLIYFALYFCIDGSEKVTLKLSAKRIKGVHAYLSRGCPVLWIKPDKVWAEKARITCSMTSRKGPYIDPDSDGELSFYVYDANYLRL